MRFSLLLSFLLFIPNKLSMQVMGNKIHVLCKKYYEFDLKTNCPLIVQVEVMCLLPLTTLRFMMTFLSLKSPSMSTLQQYGPLSVRLTFRMSRSICPSRTSPASRYRSATCSTRVRVRAPSLWTCPMIQGDITKTVQWMSYLSVHVVLVCLYKVSVNMNGTRTKRQHGSLFSLVT